MPRRTPVQSPPSPPRYATVKDAAQYAAVSPDTVRRWLAAGRLRPLGDGARILRVDLNEVDAVMGAGR